MDAFSPIPDHTGFKARNLFADGQQILKGGAFAKIAPGGVLHAVWNKNQEPAEILGLTLETPPSPAP